MINTVKTLVFAKNGKAKAAIVEVEVLDGIGIHVVGMNDRYVKDVLLRVVTAMQRNGYSIPGKKVVIRITGKPERYEELLDYPIYIALIMAATGKRPSIWYNRNDYYVGSLRLDGSRLPLTDEQYYAIRSYQIVHDYDYNNERIVFERPEGCNEIGL